MRHQFDSSGNYSGGSLKVYRKRVEPNGSQTEIYMETFVQIGDEEDYPVSVSDLILADNRSKFYFVLDFHGEGMRAGKSELCTTPNRDQAAERSSRPTTTRSSAHGHQYPNGTVRISTSKAVGCGSQKTTPSMN